MQKLILKMQYLKKQYGMTDEALFQMIAERNKLTYTAVSNIWAGRDRKEVE